MGQHRQIQPGRTRAVQSISWDADHVLLADTATVPLDCNGRQASERMHWTSAAANTNREALKGAKGLDKVVTNISAGVILQGHARERAFHG